MTVFALLVFFLSPPLIKLSLPKPTVFTLFFFFFHVLCASIGSKVGSEQVAECLTDAQGQLMTFTLHYTSPKQD